MASPVQRLSGNNKTDYRWAALPTQAL